MTKAEFIAWLQPKQSIEKLKAPFTDKDGKELWSNDLVYDASGNEAILRYGFVKINDEDTIVDICGWYLEVGMLDASGRLVLYLTTSVVKETPANIRFAFPAEAGIMPSWYQSYLDVVTSKENNDGV